MKHVHIKVNTVIVPESPAIEVPINAPDSLNRAIDYLLKNYQVKIYMADIAKCACISEPHLSHLFKTFIGLSFKKFLIKIRIAEAKQRLIEKPTRQITQIGADVGFTDFSHFEKTFKKVTGISPGRYRKSIIQPFQLKH